SSRATAHASTCKRSWPSTTRAFASASKARRSNVASAAALCGTRHLRSETSALPRIVGRSSERPARTLTPWCGRPRYGLLRGRGWPKGSPLQTKVLKVCGNDGPQLLAVGGRVDQAMQYDRRGIVGGKSIAHIFGSGGRLNFNHAIAGQVSDRVRQLV